MNLEIHFYKLPETNTVLAKSLIRDLKWGEWYVVEFEGCSPQLFKRLTYRFRDWLEEGS